MPVCLGEELPEFAVICERVKKYIHLPRLRPRFCLTGWQTIRRQPKKSELEDVNVILVLEIKASLLVEVIMGWWEEG